MIGGVRLNLDLAIGASSVIESDDKDKIESIVDKVKDLNARLQDVRREQVFQRVRRPRPALKLTAWLMMIRNERPNFETKARPQTRRS